MEEPIQSISQGLVNIAGNITHKLTTFAVNVTEDIDNTVSEMSVFSMLWFGLACYRTFRCVYRNKRHPINAILIPTFYMHPRTHHISFLLEAFYFIGGFKDYKNYSDYSNYGDYSDCFF